MIRYYINLIRAGEPFAVPFSSKSVTSRMRLGLVKHAYPEYSRPHGLMRARLGPSLTFNPFAGFQLADALRARPFVPTTLEIERNSTE